MKPQGKKVKEEQNREELQKQPETFNKMAISTYLSINTLNISGLNVPIKRHRVADWIKKKKKTNLYAADKRHTSELKTHRD